jgi:two-component system OmpR family response regulator
LPIRVLIIEDSREVQEMLRALLETIGGFQILAMHATEVDATDWMYRHRGEWDLAIMDLLLSEGSGFHLVGRSKSYPNPGKVVVFSGYAVGAAIVEKCLKLGADRVFAKEDVDGLAEYLTQLSGSAAAG